RLQDLTMPLPLPGNGPVRPLVTLLGAHLLAAGLASIASPARGDDLNGAMDQFAGRIKQLLGAEREAALALNQFTATARLAANASSGIRKGLEEALKKRGVDVRKSARLEVTGEYREIEDPGSGRSVVRIVGRISDQDTGRPVSECEVKVDDVTAI